MRIPSALLLLVVGSAVSQLLAQEIKGPEPAGIASRLVGDWDTTVTFTPARWTPKAREMKGTTSIKLLLQGRAVQIGGDWLDGKRDFLISLASDGKHQFHGFYTDTADNQSWIQSTRTKDAKGIRFHITGPPPTSLSDCRLQFIDDDTCEIAVDLADRTLAKYLDFTITLRRRK